jgi:ADP-ribose pyrophosphatase YjhB (NUDIX family)
MDDIINFKNMKKTAQVVLFNEEGLVLAVSRKDNHNDFGLPGGKMEEQDGDNPMLTAYRELKEETGLEMCSSPAPEMIFAIHKNDFMGYTYLAKFKGEINHNEAHVVKWVPFEVIIKGSFGKYNKLVAESLDDMGIKYQKLVDRRPMIAELKEFIESTTRKGYTKPFEFHDIYPNSFGGYYIAFTENMEEEFDDHDEEYENKISEIGAKYHLSVKLPYYYYMK